MFHYPRDSLLAGGEHTDYGFMTILMSSSKGLQVKSREGEWLNIDPIEDHFIINICDTLERMTKGLYKSSIHRVRNNQGVSRYSIPFFYDPGW
jgi:isopenicillin N synthase-like dioxygenase